MRTFAEKPKATSSKSARPGKTVFGQTRDARSVADLQRMIGSQAVLRYLPAEPESTGTRPAESTRAVLARDGSHVPVHGNAPGGLQPKLRIGAAGGRCEQEADRVSEQVMLMREPRLQPAPVLGGSPHDGSSEGVAGRQSQSPRPGEESTMAADLQPSVSRMLHSHGQPLDPTVRAFFEPRLGRDLSDVRLHTGTDAAEVTRSIGARAFTLGTSIAFGPGEYQPHTTEGRRLLCHELAHVIQQGSTAGPGSAVIQRRTVTFRRGDTVTSDPVQARRTFARIRESVQNYGDNSLDYFSNQYLSAMTSFQLWYARQPQADASFFNSVVNIIMNTAWAWGSPVVGAVAAPVGSIIMLIAQEAARTIQNARDQFAASLIRSANNLQAGVQRRLSGRIPAVIEAGNPALWEDIERRAYFGEQWQPLLHQRAGLPRRGVNYQRNLLSSLIFQYRRWELSQHSASYRGIYSMADPYLEHMRGRARAEASLESGQPIPRALRQYAHPGERVER